MASSRRFKRYRNWIAVVVIVSLAAAIWFVTHRSTATTSQVTYTTEQAAKGTLQVTVSGSGNLELSDQSDVYPGAGGTVDSVDVAVGDKVEKGDVLYTLDSAAAKTATAKALAAYRQAQASVAQVEVQLAKAKSALAALQDRAASPTSTVTTADINAAKAEVTAASASLSSAQASRTSAKSGYADAKEAQGALEVVSPVDGTVWDVNIEDGDTVSAVGGSSSGSSGSNGASTSSSGGNSSSSGSSSSSSAPVVVASEEPLQATLAVNETDIGSLKIGQSADLEFDALPNLAATGKVTGIANSGTVSSGVVTFDVTILLDVTNDALKPGMTVAATIVTDVARDALYVSSSAVKTATDGTYYVETLNSDGKTTKQVTVTTGLSNDTQTQILSGLKEGDTVVTATTDSSSSSSSSSGGSNSDRGGFMMMGGGPGGRD